MRLGLEAGAHTLDIAAEHGVRGVPISAEQLVAAGVDATLAPLRQRGLEVCQIGAFGYNPLSRDRGRQAREAAILERVIPLARETGCPYIVICGGNYHPSGFGATDSRNFQPQGLDEVARALAPMAALAERHSARLAIEPYLKTAVNTPERFLALQEKVGSGALCVNIDVTSLYSGFWDLLDSRHTVEHICTALAGYYGLIHVKEFALTEGFHLHAGLAPLGQGTTDWAQVLRLVEPHLPVDSWLILEHVATPEEARASLSYLRAAAAQAGVTLT